MRLSWLDPATVRAARAALVGTRLDWETLCAAGFGAVPIRAPAGIARAAWPRIAEHVARAERVSEVMRREGLEPVIERFGSSTHAVEVAVTVLAAANQGEATLPLLRQLFSCEIEEEILYGTFLRLLLGEERARVETIAIYEQFIDMVARHRSDHPDWSERAASLREGLADLYVASGCYQEGHDLFLSRHAQSSGDVCVALSASRAFLAAGERSRAVDWLGRAADRARRLGRISMERTLREKQAAIASRRGR